MIDEAPILTVPCITNAPPIMLTWNPTATRVLKTTNRLHRCITRNSTPGIVPLLVVINSVPPMNKPTAQTLKRILRLPEGSFEWCSLPQVHASKERRPHKSSRTANKHLPERPSRSPDSCYEYQYSYSILARVRPCPDQSHSLANTT